MTSPDDEKTNELISEEDRERYLKHYNQLKLEDEKLSSRTNSLISQNRKTIDDVADLIELIEKKKMERLQMSEKEVVVLSKMTKDNS